MTKKKPDYSRITLVALHCPNCKKSRGVLQEDKNQATILQVYWRCAECNQTIMTDLLPNEGQKTSSDSEKKKKKETGS